MKHIAAASFAALAAAFGATGALASPDCDLSASVSAASLQTTYDPFAPQTTVLTLQITGQNTGNQQCNAQFFVAPEDGTLLVHGSAGMLTYQIDGANGGGNQRPNERGPFQLHVPAGGSQSVSVQFRIPAQQIVPRGDYSTRLLVRGRSQANEPVTIAGDSPLLTISVPSRVEMSISGTSAPPFSAHAMAPASINFPNAQTGQTGHVFVNVWANGAVSVELSSENHGLLRHLQDGSRTPISYSATFDGGSFPLTSVYRVQRTPPMNLQGASYELAVTLGDTTHSFAGAYKDTITVDVSGN